MNTILGDAVYKRGYDGVLLRCLEWSNQQMAMHTYLDGTCGGHFSGYSIAKWIINMGYYYPTMEQDYHDYVKKCIKCQQHTNLKYTPSQMLQPI